MSHPTRRLDPAIHQPTRLGILTAACETKRIDFVSLRDLLGLTRRQPVTPPRHPRSRRLHPDREDLRGSQTPNLGSAPPATDAEHSKPKSMLYERSSRAPKRQQRPPAQGLRKSQPDTSALGATSADGGGHVGSRQQRIPVAGLHQRAAVAQADFRPCPRPEALRRSGLVHGSG